jgi:hypothetical protein
VDGVPMTERMWMRPTVRLLGFSMALALIFAASWWTGKSVGVPGGLTLPATTSDSHATVLGPDGALKIETAGLVTTAAGYTLVPRGPMTFAPGVPAELAFVVTGSGARPVTAFDIKAERRLDIVVVRRDGTAFQHVQPVMDAGGVWRAPLTLPAAGTYRAYADFVPTGGPALVLGMDLSAPGDFAPTVLRPSRTTQVAGYTVRLAADLLAGGRSEVFVAIDRNRLPVTDLEPRLGEAGHLVVLRQSDLSYLRVSPSPPVAAHGPGFAFTVDIPAAGMHRLFFEFQHDGVLYTADFTVQTGSGQ